MGKNIAIFADGTGNTVGNYDTNVLRLCRMADIRNPHQQLVIYDPGVGTLATPAELEDAFRRPGETRVCNGPLPIEDSPRGLAVLLLGSAIGYGTKWNIKRLYSELAKHYDPGDRVYLFGFSRGAFTARALAGLIYRCGLVKRRHRDKDRIEEAYELYRKHFEQEKSSEELRRKKEKVREFREKYSHPCNIRFLGIFDTVKSVGYLFPRNLPHTRHNPIVQTVRHALSLHERRSFYAPTTWGGVDADTRPAVYVPACWGSGRYGPAIRWQDVEEVWFAGCHSDVGGGYPREARSPADVSLRWMLEEARAHGLMISHEAEEEVKQLVTTITKGHLHDELARHETWKDWPGWLFWENWPRWIFWKDCARWIFWQVVDNCPHRDLENEPPPPRKIWRYLPAGPRDIAASLRRGRIAVHSTAPSCYEPKDYPWKCLKENLIDTEKYENPVAAEECGCRAVWAPDI
jgi:uncharacterized protein (DUF2235 family)